MELADLDLNQLVLFHQLMTHRRVSRAADALGLTQPAVSNRLARLRAQFGDELFLRTPGGMVPTPFAEQLAGPVAAALELIHGGINQRVGFDPATDRHALTLAMTDIGEIVFLPALVEHLAAVAPGLTLATVRTSAPGLAEEMAAGRVDLAIGLLPQLQTGFFQRRLFSQRYVCLFRRGHPLDRPRLRAADFARARHLSVLSAGTGHHIVDELLLKAGVQRDIRLTVPHFVGLGPILSRSDLVATVPERLARHLAEPFGLAWRPHPIALPEVAINVFWHARAHRSPLHQWLRGELGALFGQGPARGDGL